MNRRNFLGWSAAMGARVAIPSGLALQSMMEQAAAATADYQQMQFSAPALLPQVINIFLYGGPSELSGNLTNIADINNNSQNSYPESLLLPFDASLNVNDANFGQITPNAFWSGAGGVPMEFMLKYGHMSVYRTLMKQKNPTRSHRVSIFQGQKGNLDIENTPGVGTRLALALQTAGSALNNSQLGDGRRVSDIGALTNFKLPFVSFEGETTAFQADPDQVLDLRLRGLSLDSNFENPYNRNEPSYGSYLDALAAQVHQQGRFAKAQNGFDIRQQMADFVGSFSAASGNAAGAVPNASRDGFTIDAEDAAFFNSGVLQYPNNGFSERVRAAVILAIENPESLYITVGGGLGGWDDHNNGIDKYPDRMNDVMNTLRVAMLHIKYAGRASSQTPLAMPGVAGAQTRRTDNIVINMFGDFGRLVNLNNSFGWDHANNQNLYTFGGAAVRPGGSAALGKIVGATERVGESGTNNQFTQPVAGSYTAEPMAVGATVYSYFGVQNPEVFTRDQVTGLNPEGVGAINETVASESIAPAPFV